MEEEKKEEVINESPKEQPVVDDNVEPIKVKVKKVEQDVHKVNLAQPKDEAEEEKPTETTDSSADDTGVVGSNEDAEPVQEQEEVQPEIEAQEQTVVENVEEAPALPEGLEKLVDFMNDTGGTVEDFVRLNQDYESMDNLTALQEYYRLTKPHLNAEEVSFLMDESFSYNEEEDEAKEIRKKKIALKEQVAEAKAYLDGQKSKYYEEIKSGSRLTPEQQKAVDFFNRYNKESEENQKRFKQVKNVFDEKTNKVFSQEFKGFEFNVGEKKMMFNVKDTKSVKDTQSDINNFVKKFLNKEGVMDDAGGYHKGLYTAMNADAVAQHFYEQGKADAIKSSVEKSKNINMDPRQSHKEVTVGGTKFRVLSGDSASDFKVKMKRN